MKATLFPHHFRHIGWPILLVGLVVGLFHMVYDYEPSWLRIKVPAILNDRPIDEFLRPLAEGQRSFWRWENMTNELIAIMILVGSIFVAFSRERVEDEFHNHLRLSALVWSFYVYATLVVLSILFLYGFHFMYFMMVNLFTPLLLFIVRYHYLLSRLRVSDAKQG